MDGSGGIKHYFASWGIWVRLVARQHPVPSDFAGRRPARLRGQQAEHTARNIRTVSPFRSSIGVWNPPHRDRNPCNYWNTRLGRVGGGSPVNLRWNVRGAVARGQAFARPMKAGSQPRLVLPFGFSRVGHRPVSKHLTGTMVV